MGKYSQFRLQLKSLPQGKSEFDFKLDKTFFENMESTDIRDADVDVHLDVVYAHDVYDLTFTVSGTVTVVCDRCLEEMPWPVEASYHILVKLGDDYRDDSDELLEIPASAPDLNVAYMIYDTVSLAIPIKHVHPMGKCNRQMTAMLKKHRANPADDDAELENELIDEMDDMAADQEPATDPRWEALRGLSSNQEDSASDENGD